VSFIISWLSIALFDVSMLSGLVVAFAYNPNLAYESAQKLTYLIPYGDFFRQMHYFSSEAFLVFLLLHVILELSKLKITLSQSSWNYSLIAFLSVFFLMFTGYVLKADLSGISAGTIALSLLKQTPVLNHFLPFLEDTTSFFWKFYIWHILFLPLLLGYTLYLHAGTLKTKYFIVGLSVSIACMMLFHMPPDIAPDATPLFVHGPWFFRGAENLLKIGVHTLIIDSIMGVLFLLLCLYFYVEKYRLVVNYLLVSWVLCYAYFYTL